MKAPTVDVVIAAYNAAKVLPMALDSVIAQTFQDWRILLVDDGSTDNIMEVILPYQQRLGPKLKYIRQENGGPSAARNNAFRNSTAEYLAMLDADDLWLPCRLEESLKAFHSRPEVGLAYGFNARIDAAGNLIDTFDQRKKHAEGYVARYIYMRMVDIPCVTVTIRRECLDEVGMFDETMRITEDRDLWLRIARRYKVALVPKVIAHYRLSPAGLTTDPDRMLGAQMRFLEKHYGTSGCGWLARRVALGWMYRQRAEALANNGQMKAALKSAFRALGYSPFSSRNLRTTGSLLLRYAG